MTPLSHAAPVLPERVSHASSQPAYEARMSADPEWAMSEGSLFFEGKGAVQEAFRRIAGKLRELGIDYAVVGGMALFRHGYRRYTDAVDILVTRRGLKEIHDRLEGLLAAVRGQQAPARHRPRREDRTYAIDSTNFGHPRIRAENASFGSGEMRRSRRRASKT